jgi:hypothetical protein
MLWSRDTGGIWELAVLEGLDATADLTALGATLRLADIYDGLTFRRPPRLIADQT